MFRLIFPPNRTGILVGSEKEVAMFLSIVRLFQVWRRYNASIRELSRLGDRELADIGLTRGDIQRIAWENANS